MADADVKAVLHCKEMLYEKRAQAAAPSKDYMQLVVNPLGCIMRTWLISPATALHSVDKANSTHIEATTLHNFLEFQELHDQILNGFGEEVLGEAIACAREAHGVPGSTCKTEAF